MKLSSNPYRVPFLWILIPFSAGIFLARSFEFPGTSLNLTLAFIAIGLATWLTLTNRPSYLWKFLFATALVFLGMARFETESIYHNSPAPTLPREASLELKIDTLYNAADPETALGIARVVDVPLHQELLAGKRIFFFLETKSLNQYPVEGESFHTIGVVRALPDTEQADRFDTYLRNLGIDTIYKQGEFLERSAAATGLQHLSNYLKEKLSSILSQNSIPHSPATGAYKGLMLGQKSELSSEQKELFLANGTMHLFAISGLHIGVIALCFHHLLGTLRLRGGYKAIGSLLGICTFVIATGGSASSWRATLMIACLYLVNTTQRQPSPINALVLSAIVYLMIMPHQLFQAGFQMSYLTVATILMLGLPLARSLNSITPLFASIPVAVQTPTQRAILSAKRWTLDTLGVSTAAFLISALLGMYYFQILPSYGILINMIALPIASLAIVAGFLSLLLSPLNVVLPISYLFNNAALVLIDSIQIGLISTSKFPGASIHTPAIPAATACAAILSTITVIAISYGAKEPIKRATLQIVSVLSPLAWIAYLATY